MSTYNEQMLRWANRAIGFRFISGTVMSIAVSTLILLVSPNLSAQTDLTVARKPVWQNQQSGANVATKLNFESSAQFDALNIRHQAGRSPEKWMPEVLGGGVVVLDANSDGAEDILLINSGRFAAPRPTSANDKLLINDGNGVFSDQSKSWGIQGTGYGMGAAVGDVDNNGFPDLFLTNYEGQNTLLLNDGTRFTNVTKQYGLAQKVGWSTSAAFADLNQDGWLDLIVARYVDYDKEKNTPQFLHGVPIYSAPTLYDGLSNLVYLNSKGSTFEQANFTTQADKSLALAVVDIDKDGDQDIYVANDTNANRYWVNKGDGSFEERAKHYGLAYSKLGREQASMGVDVSDIDFDGTLDLAVSNFHGETTSLYQQADAQNFREVSDAAGIGLSARQRLSFGTEFFDADNDGDEDLLVVNGHIDDNIWKNSSSVSFAQYNTLYESDGSGKFTDISGSAGSALQAKQVSRGLAVADFNADGRLDYVVVNNDDQLQLAINKTKEAGNFISLWLRGKNTNRSAIGAVARYQLDGKQIERQIMGGQSYLSVSSFLLHLGLQDLASLDELEITWPGGATQTFSKIAANKFYLLDQGGQLVEYTPGKSLAK